MMTDHISDHISNAAAVSPVSQLTIKMADISSAAVEFPAAVAAVDSSARSITIKMTEHISPVVAESPPSQHTPIRDLYSSCIDVMNLKELSAPYLRFMAEFCAQLQRWGSGFFGDQADLDDVFSVDHEMAHLKTDILRSLTKILHYLGKVIHSNRSSTNNGLIADWILRGSLNSSVRSRDHDEKLPLFTQIQTTLNQLVVADRKEAIKLKLMKEVHVLENLTPSIVAVREYHLMKLDEAEYQNRGGVRYVLRQKRLQAAREALLATRAPEDIPGPEKRGEVDMMKERMKAGVKKALDYFTCCFTLGCLARQRGADYSINF